MRPNYTHFRSASIVVLLLCLLCGLQGTLQAQTAPPLALPGYVAPWQDTILVLQAPYDELTPVQRARVVTNNLLGIASRPTLDTAALILAYDSARSKYILSWHSMALLTVLPAADRERIYESDVRKLFTWYALLLQAGELAKKEEAEPAAEEKGKTVKAKAGEAAPKKAAVEAGAKKASAPKPAGGSKPKAATMRKSAQRGS